MLKIYGADASSPANKVRFCANYLGIPFEYIRVNLRSGEHKLPDFLKLNPISKIPVIDDEGFTLFESGAICKYLCRKNNSPLYPQDIKKVAVVDQWIDFAVLHIGMNASKVIYNRVFVPMGIGQKDEQALKDGANFLARFLPNAEEQLKKNKYLAGEEMSLADISLLASLDAAEAAQIDLSLYTSLTRWRNNLMQQDFYQKTHKSYTAALERIKAAVAAAAK